MLKDKVIQLKSTVNVLRDEKNGSKAALAPERQSSKSKDDKSRERSKTRK